MFPQEDQVRQLRSQLNQKENQLINYQNTVNKLETEVKSSKEEKDQLLQELNRREQSHVNLENQLQRLQKEIKQKSEWCGSLQMQLSNNKAFYQEQDLAAKRVLSEAQQKDEQIRAMNQKIQEVGKEVEHYINQCKSADQRLSTMKQQYEQHIQELQSNITTMSQQYDVLNIENQGLKNQLSNMPTANLQTEQNSNQTSKIDELEKLVQDLKTALEKSEQESCRMRENLKQLQPVVDEKVALLNQVESLEKQVVEYKEDSEHNYEMAGKLKQAMIDLDAKASQQFEQILNQKVDIETKFNVLQGQHNEIGMKNSQLEEMIASLKKQLEQRCEEYVQQNQVLESNKLANFDQIQKERDQMHEEYQSIKQHLENEQQKFAAVQKEFEVKNLEHNETNKVMQGMQNSINQLQSEKEQYLQELRKVQSDLEQQSSNYQQLSEQSDHKIQELQQHNKKGYETLKERESLILNLQETVHNLNIRIEELTQHINGCKDQIEEKDDLIKKFNEQINQLEMNKTLNIQTMDNLREELRNMADGKENVTSNVSELQSRVSQLELEVAQSQKQVTVCSRERKQLVVRYDATIRCLKEDLDAKQQIIQYLEKEAQSSERTSQDQEFRIQELETQKSSIMDSCEQLELNLQTQQTQRILLQKKNQDLTGQIKEKEDQLSILERNLEELDSERMEMINKINQLQQEKKWSQERVKLLENQIGGLKGDQVDLGQQSNYLEMQLQEQQQIISRYREEISKLKDQLEVYRQKSLEESSKISTEHILEEKEQHIQQLKNELVMEKHSAQTLAQQLQQEQERFDRELNTLKQQAKNLTPSKTALNFSQIQSPGIVCSPQNDAISDLMAQRELLQRLCDNLTKSNQKLTQKIKDYARKFKLVSAKYENLKKQLEDHSVGVTGVISQIGQNEDLEISPLSDQFDKENSQDQGQGQSQGWGEVCKQSEGAENKDLQESQGVDNDENEDPITQADAIVDGNQKGIIPETPLSDMKVEDQQIPMCDEAQEGAARAGDESPIAAPLRKQQRLSHSPVNQATNALLAELKELDKVQFAKYGFERSAPEPLSQTEYIDIIGRRLSFQDSQQQPVAKTPPPTQDDDNMDIDIKNSQE